MKYEKKGHIFKPDRHYEWMHYYGGPVSSVEFESHIRVYFATRNILDEKGHFKTHITFVDCDKNDPTKVIRIHDRPILEFGPAGTFDEHGTMVADVVEHDGKYYMYYMGWQRSDTVPYLITLGLAVSDDGENFTKVSNGPVIGISRFVSQGIGNVSVCVEDGVFHMWYTHYLPWIETANGYRPSYDIRYAWSSNGLDWQFDSQCIAPANDNESLATPCVRKINGRYHMWYSVRPGVDEHGRSGPYKIGYAVSDDKKNWTRMDETADIPTSDTGWDSEMICYPDVLQVKDRTLLFYCGNGYGRDGFGYAEIEKI